MNKKALILFIIIGLVFFGVFVRSYWIAGLNQNLIYYWAMDHQSGTTATENVTGVRNVTTLGNNWASGILGNSYNNTGSNLNGGITGVNSSQFGINWSMNFWLYHERDFIVNSVIFGLDGATENLTITSASAEGVTFKLGAVSESRFVTANTELHKWYMFTITRNHTGYTIYRNATVQGYVQVNNAQFGGTNLCLSGGSNSSCSLERATAGTRIDEVGIWNKSLLSNEVVNLYNSGQASFYSPSAKQFDIVLNTPANNSIYGSNNVYFNASVNTSVGSTLHNSTIYIYSSNGTLANMTSNLTILQNQTSINITGLKGGDYVWNIIGYGKDTSNLTVTNIANGNFTLGVGFSVNGEHWKNTTTEGNNELFQLNISLPSGKTISSASLIYNNTLYSGSINEISSGNYSLFRTLTTPNVLSNSNLPFYWNITLSSTVGTFESNVHTQAVNIISLDSCGTNPILILNYSVLDEEARTFLSGVASNTTVEVDVDIFTLGTSNVIVEFNKTFNVVNATNPARVCIGGEILNTSSYRMDVVARYEALNHVSEFHNIQNFTLTNNTIPQLIELHDLLTTDSQEFLITFKDSSFLAVEGALIDITRKYIGEGVYRSVEVPKTDTDGQAIAHLVLSDVIYTLIVKKNGVILGTFPDITSFCNNQATGDCKINLNTLGSGVSPTEFSASGNVAYNLNYNQTSRIVKGRFSSLDGSSLTMLLNTTVLNGYNNLTVCSDAVTSSSGTLTCTVPASINNVTLVSKLYKNGVFVGQKIFTIDIDEPRIYRGSIAILVIILFLTIPLLALTSGTGTIILAMFSIIIMAMLNLFDGGSIIGIGSTILWALIAGGVLLWKINNK